MDYAWHIHSSTSEGDFLSVLCRDDFLLATIGVVSKEYNNVASLVICLVSKKKVTLVPGQGVQQSGSRWPHVLADVLDAVLASFDLEFRRLLKSRQNWAHLG